MNTATRPNGKWESRPRYRSSGVPDSDYDKNRLKTLRAMQAAGTLPAELEPELRYLRGERPKVDWSTHRKAQDQIHRLNGAMTLKEIAGYCDSSAGVIHAISSGVFREVSKGSAREVYYSLKKVKTED